MRHLKPSALNMWVNSTPVTPDPMTQRCSGISCGGYAWRVVRMRSPSTSAQSGMRGRDPGREHDEVGVELLLTGLGLGDDLAGTQQAAPVPR